LAYHSLCQFLFLTVPFMASQSWPGPPDKGYQLWCSALKRHLLCAATNLVQLKKKKLKWPIWVQNLAEWLVIDETCFNTFCHSEQYFRGPQTDKNIWPLTVLGNIARALLLYMVSAPIWGGTKRILCQFWVFAKSL
jgi:hypothetical protein